MAGLPRLVATLTRLRLHRRQTVSLPAVHRLVKFHMPLQASECTNSFLETLYLSPCRFDRLAAPTPGSFLSTANPGQHIGACEADPGRLWQVATPGLRSGFPQRCFWLHGKSDAGLVGQFCCHCNCEWYYFRRGVVKVCSGEWG